MKQLHNKVAVVTGAASGIGRALALQLADAGCRLAIADIDGSGLAAVERSAAGKGVAVYSQQLDVSERQSMQHFASAVAERFGSADIVINNAGVTLADRFEHASYDDLEWVMNINFWGVLHGCKAFLPQLRQQQEAALVNVSSIFAMVSFPTQAIYNASKAAVRSFSDALRTELVDSGVTLTCVHPGGIQTAIARNARVGDIQQVAADRNAMIADFEQIARTTPEAAARAIIQAIRRKRTRLLIGADAKVLDTAYRLFPARVALWAARGAALKQKLQSRSARPARLQHNED